MNTDHIERAICQDPSAEAIFTGVYARDKLPKSIKYPAAMVWNTDPADQPGEHWVAAYFNEDGIGEYFDSYGADGTLENILTLVDWHPHPALNNIWRSTADSGHGTKYNYKTCGLLPVDIFV